MTTMTLQLDDAKAEALRQKARRVGLDPEQFLMASVDDLIAQPDVDFDHAAERVLSITARRVTWRRTGYAG